MTYHRLTLALLLLLFVSVTYSKKQSFDETPFLLKGHNVHWPGQSYNIPKTSVAQMKNAFRSTSRMSQLKYNGENPFKNSGFINVDKQHNSNMYYLFFESQNSTDDDTPLILWLQGGPGCSSMTGAFAEVGPFRVDDNLNLVDNPYSWNKNAHLLFIDNPVGAGFSYTDDDSGYVTNEEEVAENLYKALQGFFAQYPHLKSNSFFIAGESYAGKYIPSIAYKIMQEGYEMNLKGVAIGDGLTHPLEQFAAYKEFSYVNGLVGQTDLKDVTHLENMAVQAIKNQQWSTAAGYSDQLMSLIVSKSGGVNVYDIRELGNYNFDNIDKYLALPSVKKMMHTEGRIFHDCDGKTYQKLSKDIPQTVLPKVEALLKEQKTRVLFYNGMFDLIITSVGTSNFLRQAKWQHQQDYAQSKRRIWKVDNSPAGWVRSASTLAFVQIHDAGHLSPFNQPKNLQSMIYEFIHNKF